MDSGLFNGAYNNTRVLVTGHTGFKGSWLSLWLAALGAKVAGYSLAPERGLNHYRTLGFKHASHIADIRDLARLTAVMKKHKPDVVFHLAAQSLVRLSYDEPVTTFETNVMGTVNVLEAARAAGSVRALINITSDKCYENREWVWGYRETDPMGGHDPYSASKGCAELVTASYRNAFFPPSGVGRAHNTLVASARAGNVIGGGDWALDRIVPDIARAARTGAYSFVRNPWATRPWQHVLEPLSGYLLLGQRMLAGEAGCAEAWNFGPGDGNNVTVLELVRELKRHWPEIKYKCARAKAGPHEAGLLKLDCSKARHRLGWTPALDFTKTVSMTAAWYREFLRGEKPGSMRDIQDYVEAAAAGGIGWAAK